MSHLKFKGARLLNERTGILGLSIFDLGILGYLLIISHGLLSTMHLELLSFPLVGAISLLLIQIRLSHRRKSIRDYLRNIILSRLLHFYGGR